MNTKLKKILLWIFIGLLSLGQFQRIELSGSLSGVNIYLHDVFIFLWLISFGSTNFTGFTTFTHAISGTNSTKRNFIKKIFSKFKLEIALVTIIISGIVLNVFQNADFLSLLYVLRLSGYIFFALSLRNLVLNKEITLTNLRFKFFGAGLIILLLGFLQLILVKDTRFLAILGWDDHFHRLISTIFDPGFTGIILVISYLYFLSLRKGIFNKLASSRLITSIINLSFLWGIALTFSRATYLSLIVALIGLGIIKKSEFKIKESFVTISVFIAMILFVPKPGGEGVNLSRTSTISARESVAQKQISSINLKTILIGNGLFSKQNRLADLRELKLIPSHSRIPDNFFINIFLSTGIFGTGLIIFTTIKWIVKTMKVDPELGIAILATIIHSQFNNSIFQSFVLLMLLGGVASLKNLHNRNCTNLPHRSFLWDTMCYNRN